MRRGRADAEGRTEAFQQVTRRLNACKDMIGTSPWAGLTELTQKAGEECADSVSFFFSFFLFLF
jgi:glycogen debranching enzyme